MAEIIWTEPAINDLDAIADFIALENQSAASELVRRIFEHVEQLASHPESGSRPTELKKSRYRQIISSPSTLHVLNYSWRRTVPGIETPFLSSHQIAGVPLFEVV